MADFFDTQDTVGNVWFDEVGNLWQVFNCSYIVEDIIDQQDVENLYGKKKIVYSDALIIDDNFDDIDDVEDYK